MSTKIQLNPRLRMAASMVRPGVKFADIGTDHAYLPIALLLNNAVSSAIGADLREGPLAHAYKNASQYGVLDRISLRCCNGLSAIAPDEADDIVIAGMGGELIASILRAAPWVKNPDKRLILQPMSSAEDLRRYLVQEGFYIQREEAVEDTNRIYTVMLVRYDSTARNDCFCGFEYIGALNMNDSMYAREYGIRQLRHLAKKLQGQQMKCTPEATHTLELIRNIAQRIGGQPVVFSGDVYDAIDGFAPFDTAMSFDNVGLLVGGRNQIVTKAMLALDITPEVIREASDAGAQLVISHHPVIFDPIRVLPDHHPVYMLASNHLAAICAHTNLDMAKGGVNTCLAEKLALDNPVGIEQCNGCDEALMGTLPRSMTPAEFAAYVRDQLGCGSVQLTAGTRPIQTVALCSGAGGSLLDAAVRAGADAFVTGEAKHNQMLDARSAGITLVAAGHHHTENLVLPALQRYLTEKFPAVELVIAEQSIAPSVSI